MSATVDRGEQPAVAAACAHPPVLLEMRGIHKSFPGVTALRGVDLEVRAGEVLALVGENGAGKSTLIKVLAGAHRPDTGSILIDGNEVVVRDPVHAQRLGLTVIYQEFNLVPALSVRDNIFLGREAGSLRFVRQTWEKARAAELLRRIGLQLPLDLPCRQLTVAQQQVVEIAKALALQARVLVMDEPSAALTPVEVERLFAVIRDLKNQGIGIIYVSHRLDEVLAIADRVTVLRDGAHIATRPINQVNRSNLIELMVGRRLEQEFPARHVAMGEERLTVKRLTRGQRVRDVSFGVRRGEVLGVTGLMGAGRTEMARLIFGADQRDSGEIFLDGREVSPGGPRQAIAAGIALLTEDRKGQGLVLGRSVRENFGLPNMHRFSQGGFLLARSEQASLSEYVRDFGIKITNSDQLAVTLSGGTQQKVVLAKWLARQCEVIIFDEPTRGIDVGAKFEVYQLINELASQGKAILLISSELPEVLGMSDRILVMREGRITGEVSEPRQATQQQILDLAVG